MSFNVIRILPLVASAFLFVSVPSIWPYGFYMFMRVVVCGISLYLAYFSKRDGKEQWMVVMVLIALLFNPIFPVHLTKEIWGIIDFAAAVIFIGFRRQNS